MGNPVPGVTSIAAQAAELRARLRDPVRCAHLMANAQELQGTGGLKPGVTPEQFVGFFRDYIDNLPDAQVVELFHAIDGFMHDVGAWGGQAVSAEWVKRKPRRRHDPRTEAEYEREFRRDIDSTDYIAWYMRIGQPYRAEADKDVRAMAAVCGLPSVYRLLMDDYWCEREPLVAMTQAVFDAWFEAEPTHGMVLAEIHNPGFTAMRAAMKKAHGDTTQYETVSSLNWHLYKFVRAGQRRYSVSDALAAKLRDTELRGLTGDDLRLPYASLCIHVPPPARLVMDDAIPVQHVRSIVVSEDMHGSYERFLLVGGVNPDTYAPWHAPASVMPTAFHRTWRVFLSCQSYDAHGLHLLDKDANYRLSIQLDALDVDASIKRALGNSEDVFGDGHAMWARVFRWAINVIIYATSVEAGELFFASKKARELKRRAEACAPGRTKQNLYKALANLEPGEHRMLGRSIVIDRHAAAHEPRGAAAGTDRLLTVRTRVSGHWRRQPHGPGRSERRLQWIEPFWRGPELGAIVENHHSLR